MTTRKITSYFGPTELYRFNQYGKYHIGFEFDTPVILTRHQNGRPHKVLYDGSIYWPTDELRNRVFNEPSAATIIELIRRLIKKERSDEDSKSNFR